MATTAASILIFASPGASAFSGSHVGSLSERGHREISASEQRPSRSWSRSESDPCSTFERCNYLAGRRLKIIGKRERRIVALLVRIHKLRASQKPSRYRHGGTAATSGSPARIICSVFGAHCSEAISVATCESHLNPRAIGGAGNAYYGLFQFGPFARAHYGFAWDALTQARAAYRYFLDAGWSPWQCQP